MVQSEPTERSSLRVSGRALGVPLGIEALALSVTGVGLLFSYRPEPIRHVTQFGQKAPEPLALPWDQLALRAVHLGTIRGFGFLLPGNSVRALFVLIDDTEVSPTTFRLELVAHLAIGLVALLALAAAGPAIMGRTPQAPPPPFTENLNPPI